MKYIEQVDFISMKPKIMIYSESRYKNVLGGLLSILAFLSCIGISSYFIYICIKREEILIIYNETESKFPVKDFFSEPVLFTGFDPFGRHYKDLNRYISVIPSYQFTDTKRRTVNFTNLKMDYNCGDKLLELWPNIRHTPHYEHFKGIKHTMCIDPRHPELKNKTIYGRLTDGTEKRGFSYLDVYINKCMNNTKMNITHCHPQEKIDKALNNFIFAFITINNGIDNYNLTSTRKSVLRIEAIHLSPNLYRKINIKYRAVNYTTDYGFLFESNTQEYFNIQEPYTENVDLKTNTNIPGNFAVIKFLNSDIGQLHKRQFMKFQTLLANIGGAVKGILLTITITQSYLSDSFYYLRLSNNIISFEGLDKIYKKDEKTLKLKNNSNLSNESKKINTLNNTNNKSALKFKNNFTDNVYDSTIAIGKVKVDETIKNNSKLIPNINRPVYEINNLNKFERPNFNPMEIEGPNFQKVLEPIRSNIKKKSLTHSDLTFPKLNFIPKEYLKLFCKRGRKYDVLKVIKKYIDKKSSIDHIISKLHDFEIHRFVTLEADHLKWMQMIPGPDINNLYNKNMTSKIQELWSENGFNHEITAIEKSRIKKSLINKEEYDNFELKLLMLTEEKQESQIKSKSNSEIK